MLLVNSGTAEQNHILSGALSSTLRELRYFFFLFSFSFFFFFFFFKLMLSSEGLQHSGMYLTLNLPTHTLSPYSTST